MAHYNHVIYACYQNILQTCLPRVNMRQITLMIDYIHPNEQPVRRSIYTINALFFRCTLMILHLTRIHRNVNRNVYNAGKV